MLATLSAQTFDPVGYIELILLRSASKVGEISRRATRIATLDGGAAVNDFGQCDADRTFEFAWTPLTAEGEAAVVRMLQTYGLVNVSVPDGVFSAIPETYTPGAESRLRLLVVERMSE